MTEASPSLPDELTGLLDQIAAGVPDPAMAAALARAWTGAPYLRALMRSRPLTLARLLGHGPRAACEAALGALEDETPVALRLRCAKADVALVVALADLAGKWGLEETTAALSDFADRALGVAIVAAIDERTPGAPPQGFVALALGKLGSRELNYSSDVDLILLHDRDRLPRRDRDDPDEAAVRIARRVVTLMQARDADGYVFRVDLRLRPSPEATPIAIPAIAAETYYQSEALPWERAAFIRARACAGDLALGQTFLAAIQPFVWRRSLDYGAIRDVQAISLRIRDHFAEGQSVGPGFDLKRGRGGIREIEFFAQIHQMIFGGREPALRAPATLDALAALAKGERIAEDDATTLASAYRLLRTIEHRLQMQADEQTHSLPTAPEACASFARFCGFKSWDALVATLERETIGVARRYDALIIDAKGATTPREAQALGAHAAELGFADPPAVVRLVEGWRSGRYRALRSAAAQAAFEAVLPDLLAALARGPDPQAAIARLDSFLGALPIALQLFELLARHPKLVALLGRLLGLTPTLADALARAPALFDALLSPDAFAPLPNAAALEVELRLLTEGRHLEDKLDRVRRWTAERRFQIGAQLVEGLADPLAAAAAYAALADAALRVLAGAVTEDFAAAHGQVPGGRLVVLGFGRYGGAALTARSDLDLVYLFSGAHEGESDGARPLATTVYFNRLAQRLTAALSVPTAAGTLYEVDTRLRPSGAQGLLAVSIDTFTRYQREEAWTWEHMALTRARVTASQPQDARAVEAVIAQLLDRPRDTAKLRADVLDMRAEMDREKAAGGPWDVKRAPGGLIDLEFIVHYLQLRERTAFTPDLRAACAALIDRGLLPATFIDAHDLMTRLLVMQRLLAPNINDHADTLSAPARALLARATGHGDFAALDRALHLAKAVVVAAWEATFGSRREGAAR